MRIISKFRDYYDIGQGVGFDDTIMYLRKTKILNGEEELAKERFKHLRSGELLLGFCGKIYPLVILRKLEDEKKTPEGKLRKVLDEEIVFSYEEYV